MKIKEKLIKSLVDLGKKYRILVYPTLALIAIISAISNMVYWGRGNGKRVIASITVMALLITQSLFLTSSANTSDPAGDNSIATSSDATPDSENSNSNDIIPEENLDSIMLLSMPNARALDPTQKNLKVVVKLANSESVGNYYILMGGNTNDGITLPANLTVDENEACAAIFANGIDNGCVTYDGYYSDPECTIKVTQSTNVDDLDADNDGEYVAYVKATIDKIKVNYEATDDSSLTTVVYADASNLVETYNPVANTITFDVLTGNDAHYATRLGYNFTGISIDGTQIAKPASHTVALAKGQTSITVKTCWAPKPVKITYDAVLNTDPLHTVSVAESVDCPAVSYVYGGTLALADPVSKNWGIPNDGYVFDHWEYNGTSVTACDTIDSLIQLVETSTVVDYSTDEINIGPLVGVWTYKNYMFTGLDSNGDLSATYGDEVNYSMDIVYSSGNDSQSKLGMHLSDATIASLAEYGITVTPVSERVSYSPIGNKRYYGRYVFEGSIRKVSDTSISIPVEIVDMNKPQAQGDNFMSSTINLIPSRRVVTIDANTVMDSLATSRAPQKTYDGNLDINVKPEASLLNIAYNDDIKATFDQAAKLDTKDAGTNKGITLYNVTIVGAKSDNYKIVTAGIDNHVLIEERGKVDQKPITLYMKVKDSNPAATTATVKYGQPNPLFELYLLDNSIADLTDADVVAYNNDTGTFMSDVIGLTGFRYTRDPYSPAGRSYIVTPTFSGTANYLVQTAGLEGEVLVIRDAAALNNNYTISDKQSLDYYQDITITPMGGYNEIRLCSTLADDVDNDSKLGSFKPQLTYDDLGDLTDATIYFQMRDSATGAITSIETINHLNVDKTGPSLVGFDVTPLDKINSFIFGAYYHPQNDVNVLTFTFEYTSDNSKCAYLHYYLEDKDGNRTGNTKADKKFVLGADGKYRANISLSVDEYGQLVVYATDEAGNESLCSRVNISTFDEFIKQNPYPGDYYEWMVENTRTDGDLEITSSGAVVTTSGVYNHLDFKVEANDEVNQNATSGVNRVEWKVVDGDNNVVMSETSYVPDTNKKYTNHIFTSGFPGMGIETLGDYTVSAKVYDNAGNELELGPLGPYRVDSKKPIVTDNTPSMAPGTFAAGVMMKFTVTEGVGESGIDKIRLYKKTQGDISSWTLLEEWSNIDASESFSKYCEHYITENGNYAVVAYDKAGNTNIDFVKTLDGISDVTPDAPSITVSIGTKNDETGWYVGFKPTIKISTNNYINNGIPVTSDGVPIHTNYTVKVKGTNVDIQRTYTSSEFSFDAEYEGEITVLAENISASQKKSVEATSVIKVDTVKPVITITGSTLDENGDLIVSYEIYDKTSGVNLSSVTVNGQIVRTELSEETGKVRGSFVAKPGKEYEVKAKDNAGNEAEETTFKPLDIVVFPIVDVTTNSALLNADILVGTYSINNYYVAYRKHGTDRFSKYSLVRAEQDGDVIKLICPFKNLESDTEYDYRVYALADVSNEEKKIEGTFKTGSIKAAANVYGSVKYDNSLLDELKTYPIYVTLYKGDTSVGGAVINSSEEKNYLFKNLPDGSYQITADNGKLKKTASVIIENGGIIYPSNYLAKDGVNLVLSGLSTSVVIEDKSINLTADNLDIIYDDDFHINITQSDYDIVNEGGNILVTLHARYMNVASDVSSATEGIIKQKLGKDAEVVRYIELYITKTVTDKNGVSKVSNITELIDPVTISFPLGELAGEKIYVASLHQNSLDSNDYEFYNWSNAASATISHDYVTISLSKFSVFALYRLLYTDQMYTVKWIDGDGNIIKTESVKDGNSAIPPAVTPTKKPTANYTYMFDRWDLDYSTVTGDMIVSALFSAKKINNDIEPENPDKPTPNNPDDNKPGNDGDNTGISKPTSGDNNYGDNDSGSDKPGGNYGYLGSPESPGTGDATPIIFIVFTMIISLLGIMLLSKKRNK